jgi:hypothetical protein
MERRAKPNGKNRTENVDLRETMKKTTKRNIKGEEKSLKGLRRGWGECGSEVCEGRLGVEEFSSVAYFSTQNFQILLVLRHLDSLRNQNFKAK